MGNGDVSFADINLQAVSIRGEPHNPGTKRVECAAALFILSLHHSSGELALTNGRPA